MSHKSHDAGQLEGWQPSLCFRYHDVRLTSIELVTLSTRISTHAPQFVLSLSHYFLSDLIGNVLTQSFSYGLGIPRDDLGQLLGG